MSFHTPRVVMALLVATTLAGCGAGQISQTASQEPAVNGTVAGVGDLALRNVHLQAVETGDALEPGSEVPLILTITNQSPQSGDKLVEITSEFGTVSLTPKPAAVPVNGSLVIGSPDGAESLGTIANANAAKATVVLTKPIRNGLNYDFTFKFEKAGDTTVAVPISAGNAPRQNSPLGGH